MILIDNENPEEMRWPSGAIRAPDGRYIVVWERTENGGANANIYARETFDLLDATSYGPIVQLNTPLENGYDPSVSSLSDNSIVATWDTGDGVRASARLDANVWEVSKKIYGTPDPNIWAKEQASCRIGKQFFVAFNEGPNTDPATVKYFELLSGPIAGTPVVITINGTGLGTEGKQKRVNLVRGKQSNQIIAAFSRNADGGPRPIAICRSTDSGLTWTDLGDVLRWTRNGRDYDLVNPCAVRVAPTDVRLYFTVDHYGLGMSSTHDGGLTWDPITLVSLESPLNSAHIFVIKDTKGRLVAFCTTGQTMSGSFKELYATELV